jgi:hypothetical protein
MTPYQKTLLIVLLLLLSVLAANAYDLQQVEVTVVASCDEEEFALSTATDLLKLGYNVISFRADPELLDRGEISFEKGLLKVAESLERDLRKVQTVSEVEEVNGEALIEIVLACKRKIVARPAVPIRDAAMGLKALEIAVLNGCISNKSYPLLVRRLIRGGFDVVRVDEMRISKALDKTRIRFRPPYDDEANRMQKMLPGKQRVLPLSNTNDVEQLVIEVGCDLKLPGDWKPHEK